MEFLAYTVVVLVVAFVIISAMHLWCIGGKDNNENKRISKDNKAVCCGVHVRKKLSVLRSIQDNNMPKVQMPIPAAMDVKKRNT